MGRYYIMSDDVLITPASRKIEFFDSGGNIDGKIELDGSGNLSITSAGSIAIGDITQDIHIGDGTQAVDLVFDFASSIYSVANQDLTIGKKSLGGNDIIIDTPSFLNVQTDSGYVRVGPQNGSFSHFVTDRAKYYFNKPLIIDGGNSNGDAYLISAYNDEDFVIATNNGSDDRITIKKATGKVGIGTTSPDDLLHLKGTDAALLVEDAGSDSNPAVEIKNDAVHWKLQARGGDSDKFRIVEGSNTHAVIDTSGNVGIGTTNPLTDLHIAQPGDTSTHYSALTLDNGIDTDGGRGVGMNFRVRFTSGNIHTSQIHFDFFGDKFGNSIGMNYVSGRSGSFSHHYFRDQGGTNQLMITDDGKVGIGSRFSHTVQPDALFEINESGTGAAVMRLRNTNTSYPDDTAFGTIEFYNADASGPGVTSKINAISDASGRGGQLQFQTDDTGTSPQTALLLQGDLNAVFAGNVVSTSKASFNTMAQYYYQRTSMGSGNVDLRVPVGGAGTANPNIYTMPRAGKIMAFNIIYYGGSITTTSGTDVFRITKRSSGVETTTDISIARTSLTNVNANNHTTTVELGTPITFAADDGIFLKRQSSGGTVTHVGAVLYMAFDA
tara:strand:+ start:4145 stop:5968 length:1824 start_codon:yes stop_codon:yes gene_type:complete